jgi:hypothetical protein
MGRAPMEWLVLVAVLLALAIGLDVVAVSARQRQ